MTMRYGTIKTYSELIEIPTFEERYQYLKLEGRVCDPTFGSRRYLNQVLYRSREWKDVRREVIIRDFGCDLAFPEYVISGKVMIHHLNPISEDDILLRRKCIFDMDNLICCSFDTHEAIHYGSEITDFFMGHRSLVVRRPNDTCLWRN